MIVPMFQPIKDCSKGQLFGAEVLTRWLHDGNFYAPGRVHHLTDWGEIDADVMAQLNMNTHVVERQYCKITVNVSEQTLASDWHFDAWIEQVLKFPTLTKTNLVVEITEGVSDVTLRRRWDALKAHGIQLMMDDYGHQNSTYKRLCSYPWDGGKFDIARMFVLSQTDARGVRYCRDNGIWMIGEQVQTERLASKAAWLGVSIQQGYYHGRASLLDGWINVNECTSKVVAK
jgi:EAL domain-containing protein (putative c-di-GMP-specific phosphodiesterase class I)